MKSTDIAMIILIASVSVMFAYGAVSSIPGLKGPDEAVQVKKAEKYTADVDEPSGRIFNKAAINPTVDVTIGGSAASGQ